MFVRFCPPLRPPGFSHARYFGRVPVQKKKGFCEKKKGEIKVLFPKRRMITGFQNRWPSLGLAGQTGSRPPWEGPPDQKITPLHPTSGLTGESAPLTGFSGLSLRTHQPDQSCSPYAHAQAWRGLFQIRKRIQNCHPLAQRWSQQSQSQRYCP